MTTSVDAGFSSLATRRVVRVEHVVMAVSVLALMPIDYDQIEKDAKGLKQRFNEIYQ